MLCMVVDELINVICLAENVIFANGYNCFVLCFFNKLSGCVKTKLFKAYCNSRYDCKLWSLDNACIKDFDC